MPLNKLENFIKNAEGRILYVNPNDLDSTDGIENQGNSLTKPFKTIQRALIEAARFSYLKGDDNDFVERTTILLFPGEHVVDNRPGFGIKDESGQATAVSPSGGTSAAISTLSLTLDSNFDLTQEDNILYKFNSVNGGVVVPRGTSIVGLDLRKTKIRPKYVPNPTDSDVKSSAIFRITGACYFWQFTIFDGDDLGLVFTDPVDFSSINRSKPTFSHHKLTCFEYADGITKLDQFSNLTDLDIFYSKLSNAYNKAAANREITQKYPVSPKGFAPQRPEFEIVGAFATDPLNITDIFSGDGATPGQVVTVKTALPHNLTGGTPIKIRGVNVEDYNISTKVQNVIDDNTFTYLLPFVRANLPAGQPALRASDAQVLVETDTVTGASPYIFNISLRSVFGMQGMHADGAKATGFRSMVVAQFTAVSLQKDDRAFVKYDKTNRRYSGIQFSKQSGELLSSESSSTNSATVYHLDQEANYRKGFRTSHIKVSNDAVVQIVSVFAIGFHSHFNMINGADASITNSNSNFGTFALAAEGFKKAAFEKDNKGFITSVITPRSLVTEEQEIDYLQISKPLIEEDKLYLQDKRSLSEPPSDLAQGFRIGAKINDEIFVRTAGGSLYSADILMQNGTTSSEKSFEASHTSASSSKQSTFVLPPGAHTLSNGESIRIISNSGNLPENIDPHKVYFVITDSAASNPDNLTNNEIRIASSKTNAELNPPVFIKTVAGTNDSFTIVSRVSDKKPGDLGHPIQFDSTIDTSVTPNAPKGWFITTKTTTNSIESNKSNLSDAGDISFIKRREDNRGLDEKIYKLRYVIPKEIKNGKDPSDGFVIQDSSSTNVLADTDFVKQTITADNYEFDRNTRFISQASFVSGPPARVTIRSDKPHNLRVGEQIIVKNIKCSINTTGADNKSYNGTFLVTDVINNREFKYSNVDTDGVPHSPGTFNNTTQTRNNQLPRFNRNDSKSNLFIYRTEIITPYIEGVQDGIYHLFVLNANNSMTEISNEFSEDKFNQNIVNLYPEYDRDNVNDNPPEATSFAKNFPIGEVVTNDLKKSITRESVNDFVETFDVGNTVLSVVDNTTSATLTFDKQHDYNSLRLQSSLDGGNGHINGTYFNVKIFNSASSPSSAVWNGATADLTVSGGSVSATNFKINQGGSAYTNGQQLYFDSSDVATGGIGGNPSANIEINTVGISTADGNYVQVTGITTGTDGYYRIDSVSNTSSIVIKKTASDKILNGQQVINQGPVVNIVGNSVSVTLVDGKREGTFNCTTAHGLKVGNSFRVLSTTDANLGDFLVQEVIDVDTFKANVGTSILTNPAFILKHGLSANNASSGTGGENISVRGNSFYDNDFLILTADINSSIDDIPVKISNNETNANNIVNRFPLGSYLQVGGEIMRVASSTVGSGTKIKVIRGALGTISTAHKNKSPLEKIKPLPVELRRPSILRASGHTFEYVGYGPGNYSTALPQLQNRTLSEREEFLSQSQETSCGNVVYTGMNDKGDFYIGNTKISSASGQQTTFDIPIPTVTGEDPNRLSAVFDEVIVKERLLVEGGSSKNVLSQFDGPVTFNNTIRFNSKLTLTDETLFKDKVTIEGLTDIRNGLNIQADNKTVSVKQADGTEKFSIDTDNGNTVVQGNLTVEGISSLKGGVSLGDLSTDTILVGGRFNSNLVPQSDGNRDIGTDAIRWANGYFDTVYGDGSNLTGIAADKLLVELGGADRTIAQATKDGLIINAFNANGTSNGTGGLTANLFGDIKSPDSTVVLNNGTGDGSDSTYSGSSAKVTLATETSDGTCFPVFSKNTTGGQTLHTNSGFKYDSSGGHLETSGDLISKKFLHLNGADANSGDIHTAGGSDGIAVIQNTKTVGQVINSVTQKSEIRIAGKNSSGNDVTIASFKVLSPSTPEFSCDGDVIAFAQSDKNLKNNIKPLQNALDMINSLSGNTFTWKSDVGTKSETDDIGVIAQEVEALGLPGISTTRDDGTKAVKYEKLVPILIEAVKELSAKVTALENK